MYKFTLNFLMIRQCHILKNENCSEKIVYCEGMFTNLYFKYVKSYCSLELAYCLAEWKIIL